MTEQAAVDQHSVKDRVVIVTGAGRGIGRGIAHHLAKNGAVVVAAEYKRDRLDTILTELGDLDVAHLGVDCDVGNRDSIFAMVDNVVGAFGRVDGIVNNAQSFRPVTPLEEVTERDMDLLYRTGPLGTLWAMQAVFPHMKAQGWGRIVNVGSANGIRGARGYAPYNASKEAIRALTRTAAREWGRYGIVANCYCPASAGHWSEPDADPDDPRLEAYEIMYRHHPMKRDGDAEVDIGPAVLFLLSDACRWLTGETLMLDGGGYMTA
jgi:NAD(P)-dependent dehydrogenase (short-subunit alcohol dehydrogenase family)